MGFVFFVVQILRSLTDTFGFDFRPWQSKKQHIIAEKEDILEYLKDTVEEYGIQKHIEFGIQVKRADWDSKEATWTLMTKAKDDKEGDIEDIHVVAARRDYHVGVGCGFP